MLFHVEFMWIMLLYNMPFVYPSLSMQHKDNQKTQLFIYLFYLFDRDNANKQCQSKIVSPDHLLIIDYWLIDPYFSLFDDSVESLRAPVPDHFHHVEET